MPKFGKASKERRKTLCKDLKRLVDEVIKIYDFSIVCSIRGYDEQEKAYSTGNSKAKFLESAHNYCPSFAVDVYPYPVPTINENGVKKIYDNSPEWDIMIKLFKVKAEELGIKITCGIDFRTIKDKPHIEITGWKEKVKEI